METFKSELGGLLGWEGEEVCIYDLWKSTHPADMPYDTIEAASTIYRNIVYGQLL
jgi:hypothetical protein